MGKYVKMTADERTACIMADLKAKANSEQLEALNFLDKVNEAERAFDEAEREKVKLSKTGELTHRRRVELDSYFTKWQTLKNEYISKYAGIVENFKRGIETATDKELEAIAVAGASVQAGRAKKLSPEDEAFFKTMADYMR